MGEPDTVQGRRVALADAELRESGDVECPACYGTGDTFLGKPWCEFPVMWATLADGRTDEQQRRTASVSYNRPLNKHAQKCGCCDGRKVVDRATAATWMMRKEKS